MGRWPELRVCMARIREVLPDFRGGDVTFVDFASVCGADARRSPAAESALRRAQKRLANHLEMDGEWECHRPVSPWRQAFVRVVQQLAQDPDVALPTWRADGPSQDDGLFPPSAESACMGLDELESAEIWTRNRPSIEASFN